MAAHVYSSSVFFNQEPGPYQNIGLMFGQYGPSAAAGIKPQQLNPSKLAFETYFKTDKSLDQELENKPAIGRSPKKKRSPDRKLVKLNFDLSVPLPTSGTHYQEFAIKSSSFET